MKKRILALSLAAAMVIGALASCTKTAEPASSAVEERDISLVLWGPEQDQEFLKEVSKEWGDKYAADNADVKSVTVDVQIKGEDNATTDALNDIEAAADVFGVASNQLANLVNSNAIYKVPDSIAADVKNVIGDNTTYQSSIWDGSVYGFPYTDNTAAIFYYDKSKMTDDEAKSLNTVLEKGKIATEVGGGWHDMMWFASSGAELYTKLDKNLNTMNSADTAKTLAWLASEIKSGAIVDVDNADNAAALMKDGQVVGVIHGAWAANKFKEVLGDNFGVSELPNLTVEGTGVTDAHMRCFGGSKLNVVNANSKEAEAAFSLAQAIMSLDNQVKRFEMAGKSPASTSLLSNAAIAADPVVSANVTQSALVTVANPYVDLSGYWGQIGGIMDEIAAGTLTEEADIQAKLDEAVTAMQTQVAQ